MSTRAENRVVSTIIPTHNSAKTLARCLQSIRNQTYSLVEAIVVDNFSSDETVKISESFDAKVIQQKSNQAEARNIGVNQSSGEFVLFLDSDQILSSSVVEECVGKCLNEKVEMVRIPEVFVGKGYWSVCSAIWRNRYEKVEHLYGKRVGLMHGEPRFFVKAQVKELGLFDVTMVYGEDYELYERFKSARIKEGFCSSVLYHVEEDTLKQILFKNLRYGRWVPTFVRQTSRVVFPSMLNHAFLTFVQIVREHQKPDVVFGCFVLLFVKTSSMLIGALRGTGR